MTASKFKYHEGDWISVPLLRGGFAVGIVARSRRTDRRDLALGYFFGPERRTVPSYTAAIESSLPEQAVLICVFGNDALRDGTWPVIGKSPDWNRSRWPMPKFIQDDLLTPISWRIERDEDDLARELKRYVTTERASFKVLSGVASPGLVARTLTGRLRTSASDPPCSRSDALP